MATRTNYRYIEAADAGAEPACQLTSDTVALRVEPPEDFFARAKKQEVLANGYELRFPRTRDMAARVAVFIEEERECCPFFAFEQWDEDAETVLRILWPDVEGEV